MTFCLNAYFVSHILVQKLNFWFSIQNIKYTSCQKYLSENADDMIEWNKELLSGSF